MNATLDNAKNTLKYFPDDADKLRAKLSQMIGMYERDVINNGEIRESGESICHCKHTSVVFYGSKCTQCNGVIVEQTDLERT